MTPEWLKVDEHGWPVRVKRTPYDDHGNRVGEPGYNRPPASKHYTTHAYSSAYTIGYLTARSRQPWRPYPKKHENEDPISYFQSYTKGYKAGLKSNTESSLKGH